MKKITLLVVDDIEMNRDMVRRIFANECVVLQAANGVEAMKIIESTSVEILITDIFMEPMNGYELIQNIRSREKYKKIPVIAITESDQASRKKALKAGADDLIYKPFISAILHNRVKGLLFDGFDLNRYKLAYENNPIPFALYHVIDRPDTPSYKIMYLNRAAREQYSPPYREDVLNTDETPEIRDFLLAAVRSGEAQSNTIYEPDIQKWLDWTIYPDGTGLVAAMIHDITREIVKQTEVSNQNAERAMREKELAETKTELLAAQKANKEKTDFLSRVSHDMRTPLNGILGLTQLLKDKITDYDSLQDLNQLEMSGEYLLNLITDTLDVSRIESGRLELHPIVCDGRSVFNNLIALSQPNIQAKHQHLQVKAENLPFTMLYMDVGRAEQIVMNLLSNAIKFTSEGGTIQFTMENISVQDHVITDRITIKDNGIGMSKEFLPHLFEPFSQEDHGTTSTSSGTGLGMTIVKEIIEQMGGEIQVESEPGKGTTFSFTLPMQIATEDQIREWKASRQITFQDSSLESKRVLLCEDHPLNTTIAIRLLEKKGMMVEHAHNGKEGVEMFEQSPLNHYDIILMDIRMPVLDGIEATRKIRALNRTDARTIPIVAMTANAFQEDIQKTRDAGMDAHLGKPIDTEKLYATIEKMLSVKRFYKRKKILVVDDVEANRAVLKEALQEDYLLLEASNGKEALEILEHTRGIDAVITDIQMPKMDGIQLIRYMRSQPAYENIIILANTQYGDPRQEEELLALGANDFIYKPTTPMIVQSRVRNTLAKL